MPLLTEKPGRRKFIKNLAGTTGLLVTFGMLTPFSAQAKNKNLNLALLSDTHIAEDVNDIFRGFYPYANLKTVADQVASSGLSGTIINGDLARLTGEPGDYTNLKKLLQPINKEMPIAMTLGNHDHFSNFLDSFSVKESQKQNIKNKHVMVLDYVDVQIILLDSLLITDFVSGLMGQEQRKWLTHYLEINTQKPIMIFVHHTLGDSDTDLLDTDKLLKIIKPNRQVKAVFYGHSHGYSYKTLEDIHLINLPAIGYNFDDNQPIGWVEASFGKKGGSFTLHAIGGNMAKNSVKKELVWRQ